MQTYLHDRGRAGPKRQRGAIGLFGALVLGLAVLFTALSVDSGRLMVQQRRLQSIADMAAIDGSRAVCGAVADDVGDVSAAAQASAVRNGYSGDLASEANAVQVGTAPPDTDGLRQFEPTTVPKLATAVQVIARNTVPSSLVAGGWLGGTTTLSAVATAANEPVAGLSAGSFLARVELPPDSGILNPLLNPLLNGLLGAGLDLDLVSYQGLADANVTLLDLINAHGSVGTVEELLAAQTTIGDLITLTANALSNNPDDADAALTLNNIADQVTNTTPITLGDLLDIDTTDPGAAQLSALDLLTLGAQVANGTHAVTIPTAGVNIPGVLSSDLKLYVIEKPKIAIGPAGRDEDGNWKTEVETAQVRLGLTLRLPSVNLGLAAVNLGPLNIAIDVAETKAHLESIDCPSFRVPGRVTVGVQPGIAGLALGQLDEEGNVTGPANIASATLRVTLPLLGGIDIPVSVSASSAADVASPDPESLEFDGPFPQDPPDHQQVGTELGPAVAGALGDLAGNLHLNLQVPVVGGLVNALLQPLLSALRTLVSNVVGPIIASLGDLLLTPVLSALGVTLGGADVQVLTLDGDQPALRI